MAKQKKKIRKVIQTNTKLSEDAARLQFLKEDEQECLREIANYERMVKSYSKYPKIANEILDEIQKAKEGLLVTRYHITVLEEQMRQLKRVKDF